MDPLSINLVDPPQLFPRSDQFVEEASAGSIALRVFCTEHLQFAAVLLICQVSKPRRTRIGVPRSLPPGLGASSGKVYSCRCFMESAPPDPPDRRLSWLSVHESRP